VRKLEDKDILEIGARWRVRAQAFMRDAEQSRNPRDVARLTGMSSTLDWCSNDFCVNTGVDVGAPALVSAEAPRRATVNAVNRYRRQDVARAFGLALRAARDAHGMSQDQLSEACDMDRSYPSILERGLRGPTVAMLLRLAYALDVAPERRLPGGVFV
jgi:ribosome-binding protein aMBF1 (putative translation factor)